MSKESMEMNIPASISMLTKKNPERSWNSLCIWTKNGLLIKVQPHIPVNMMARL